MVTIREDGRLDRECCLPDPNENSQDAQALDRADSRLQATGAVVTTSLFNTSRGVLVVTLFHAAIKIGRGSLS